MPNPSWKNEYFSAVATHDDVLHVAYIRQGTGGKQNPAHAILQDSSCSVENIYMLIYDTPLRYPTISLDVDGFLHVFFQEEVSDSEYKIHYSRERPNPGDSTGSSKWFGHTNPFGTSSSGWRFLSAAKNFETRAQLVWTEDQPVLQFDIMFGSFPVVSELSSAPGQPWRAEGLSPYQQYFAGFGQFVSPGNGQLTVHQTDFAFEGRELDLSLSRIYIPTRIFGQQLIAEDSCPYTISSGWRLDLPWVDSLYVHLTGGRQYLIKWNADVFENHNGEHFKLVRDTWPSLSYTLYTKDGLTYTFNEDGLVAKIEGLAENAMEESRNKILFEYGGDGTQISKITDTVGLEAEFVYGDNLESITYRTRTVQFGYDGNDLLTTVTDPIGRITTYEYEPGYPWLLTAINYPTGGRSEYYYESDKMGTETTIYRVISERFYDDMTLVRKNDYLYEDVDGRVLFAKISHYDGTELMGHTESSFDPVLGGMKTVNFDESHERMKSGKVWFGADGTPQQSDVFLDQSTKLNYSTYSMYDDWGNAIYRRDSVGHEKHASYLNTKNRNGWFKGGFMSFYESGGQKTGDYGVFYDDFLDWDLSDWSIDSSGGEVELDGDTYLMDSPSLKLSTTIVGSKTSASHSISSPAVFFEALIQTSERTETTPHFITLKSQGVEKVKIEFDLSGWIMYWDGSEEKPLMYYYDSTWYWVGIYADVQGGDSGVYDLWIGGSRKKTNVQMSGSGQSDIDLIEFKCGDGVNPRTGTMWIDKVNVYNGESLKISGLSAGERIVLLNQSQETIVDDRFDGGPDWEWSWIPACLHAAVVLVFSEDGNLDYVSPFKIAYPSHLVYSPPARTLHLTTDKSGFLRTKNDQGPYVDDSLPPNAVPYEYNDIPFDEAWVEAPLPVSGSLSHSSAVFGEYHSHSFKYASEGMTPAIGDFHIQYIYLPGGVAPRQIMIGYWMDVVGSTFVYWGEDLITEYPGDPVGDLPSSMNRWLMFIVESGEIGTAGQNVNGVHYALYGGTALWDYSALGGPETGIIRITGIVGEKNVKLLDPAGNTIADTLSSGGNAVLDLYSEGINVFPIKGYFRIEEHPSGSLIYESPVFDSLWGGDEFSYSAPTNFYPNEVTAEIHSLVAGSFEWQDGPESPDPVLMEACYKYGNTLGERARVTQTKTLHSGSWIYEDYEYSEHGNLIKYWDAKGHEIQYEYEGGQKKNAFLTKEFEIVDGVIIETLYDYYFDEEEETGELKSVVNPRLYMTEYEYDGIGRVRFVRHPDTSYVEYEYLDTTNQVIIHNERGNRIRQTFDGLGRLVKEERLEPGGPPYQPYSIEQYEHNWLGKVTKHEILVDGVWYDWTTEYDSMGRKTKLYNPDGDYQIVEYDDLSSFVTFVDEEGHKKLLSYDYGGRLISVREYYNAATGDYHETSYEYDEVGNLKKTIFNIKREGPVFQEMIEYDYDDLNRLVEITYPDDVPVTSESWEYDDLGNVEFYTDRNGNRMEFDYDEASQLKKIWYPETGHYQEYTYDENGNVHSISKHEFSEYFDIVNSYDNRDRLISQYIENNGGSVGYSGFLYFDYDDVGNLEQMTYPDGYFVTYEYDPYERAELVKDNLGVTIAELTYDEDDAIREITINENGVTSSFSYDSVRRLQRIRVQDDIIPPNTFLDMNYQYYDNGDVNYITTPDYVEEYQYDELGRLVRYDRSGDVTKLVQYEYDSIGNRMEVNDLDTGLSTYYYDPYNRVSGVDTDLPPERMVTFQYDLNGNLVLKEVDVQGYDPVLWTYNYDYDNNLRQVVNDIDVFETYYYDGLGRRIGAEHGNPVASGKAYVYAEGSVAYEWDPYSRTGMKYLFVNGILIAKIHDDTSKNYYFQDAAGNTRLILDGSKVPLFSTNYKPFGLEFVIGSETYKYSGEHYDSETGLYYYGARFYDPELGRFITEDPVEGSGYIPQSLNRYVYVLNNPLRYNDPNGELIFLVAFAILFFACVGLGAASVFIPEFQFVADLFFMVIGFIPIFGDILAAGYFLAQDAVRCAGGDCDPLSVGIDLFGLIPLAGDIAKYAKTGRYVDLLPFAGRLAGKSDEVSRVARGGVDKYGKYAYKSDTVRWTKGAGPEVGGPPNTMWVRLKDGKPAHLMRYDAEGNMMWRVDISGGPHKGYLTPHVHIKHDQVFGYVDHFIKRTYNEFKRFW
ncbi:MAG: hypothetical protein JSV43_00700 [Methanobacteriota archaeon]|nr:MAG: hypothetical protein JSV43_00700 [Euryarchaeota archaeon]